MPPTTYPVTTHPRRRATGRPRPTSTANGLIAAIALVALGTGALFFAASLGPSPAVSPSPSPTWTPPSGLVTEEVAPGVLRVVRDSAGHDLESLGVDDIAIGADGAVWMAGTSSLFRLGQPGVAPVRGYPSYRNLTVADDGTVWMGSSNANSYDGERWRSARGNVDWWAVRPDGTVWGSGPTRASSAGMSRSRPDSRSLASRTVAGPPSTSSAGRTT